MTRVAEAGDQGAVPASSSQPRRGHHEHEQEPTQMQTQTQKPEDNSVDQGRDDQENKVKLEPVRRDQSPRAAGATSPGLSIPLLLS